MMNPRSDGCPVCRKLGITVDTTHYIARSQGGLGIEENIVTLCICCHSQYDNSADRRYIREEIKAYLRSMYQDWDETKLIYRKG